MSRSYDQDRLLPSFPAANRSGGTAITVVLSAYVLGVTEFWGNLRDIFLDKFLFTDRRKRLKDCGTLVLSEEETEGVERWHPRQVP
jgi:hypothetical protein